MHLLGSIIMFQAIAREDIEMSLYRTTRLAFASRLSISESRCVALRGCKLCVRVGARRLRGRHGHVGPIGAYN